MSWDGIYRSRHHYRPPDKDGQRQPVACGRRFAKVSTTKKSGVSCFACMKKLGIIK